MTVYAKVSGEKRESGDYHVVLRGISRRILFEGKRHIFPPEGNVVKLRISVEAYLVRQRYVQVLRLR